MTKYKYKMIVEKKNGGSFRIGDDYYEITHKGELSQLKDVTINETQLRGHLLVYAQTRIIHKTRKDGISPNKLELSVSIKI